MPEHSSWLTLILSHFRETLDHNADMLGESIVGKQAPSWHSFEPLAASLFIGCSGEGVVAPRVLLPDADTGCPSTDQAVDDTKAAI